MAKISIEQIEATLLELTNKNLIGQVKQMEVLLQKKAKEKEDINM